MSSKSTDASRMLCGCQCKEHWFTVEAQRNEPDFISEEIKRLDEVLHHFCALKAQRLRQFNSIHSLTRNLPNELLFAIFEHFCSVVGLRGRPQFTLGAVCGRWYDLVKSSPQLWKKFDLILSDDTLPGVPSLLQIYQEHNGASFDYVRLDFGMFQWTASDDWWKERDLSIQRLLQSIRGLKILQTIILQQPPIDLLPIIIHDVNVPEVHLSNQLYLPPGGRAMPKFSLPWLAVTTLKLSRIQVDICCDLLLGCPNLIHFSSYDPLRATEGRLRPTAQHTRETQFPNLQHLTWYHTRIVWDNNLLSFYRFPALQHFHWCGDQHFHSYDLFHDFTSSLPPSCHTIQLSAGKEINIKLREIILTEIDHPIEQLICSHFDMTTLPVALAKLQDPNFIPSLTLFKWENRNSYCMYNERITELTQLFNDVLRSRNEMGAGRFRMEIGGLRLRSGIHKRDRKMICERMAGGWFDFEIAENGCWIMTL